MADNQSEYLEWLLRGNVPAEEDAKPSWMPQTYDQSSFAFFQSSSASIPIDRFASSPWVNALRRPSDFQWDCNFNNVHINASVNTPTMVSNYVAIQPTYPYDKPISETVPQPMPSLSRPISSPIFSAPISSSTPSPVSSPASSPEMKRTTPVKKRKSTSSPKASDPPMQHAPRSSKPMSMFSVAQTCDWKHVIYNLLVESHNSDKNNSTLAYPVEVTYCGEKRQGFAFNQDMDPRKRIAELYAHHVRKETLQEQDPKSNFTEDLYKYYLRCAYQLMCKYFVKVGPYTYIYDGLPLFIAGENLGDAEDRLRHIDTKHRRKKKKAAQTQS